MEAIHAIVLLEYSAISPHCKFRHTASCESLAPSWEQPAFVGSQVSSLAPTAVRASGRGHAQAAEGEVLPVSRRTNVGAKLSAFCKQWDYVPWSEHYLGIPFENWADKFLLRIWLQSSDGNAAMQ